MSDVYDLDGRSLYQLSDLLSIDELAAAAHGAPRELLDAVFGRVYYTEAQLVPADTVAITMQLVVQGELRFGVPGSDAVAVALASGPSGWTTLRARVDLGPAPSLTLVQVPVRVTASPELAKDASSGEGCSVTMAADVRLAADGISVSNVSPATLAPAYIAGKQILLEIDRMLPVFGELSRPEFLADQPDFQGIAFDALKLTIPSEYLGLDPGRSLELEVDEAGLGTTGFTGAVTEEFTPPFSASLCGFTVELHDLDVAFTRSALTRAGLTVSIVFEPDILEPAPGNAGPVELTVHLELARDGSQVRIQELKLVSFVPVRIPGTDLIIPADALDHVRVSNHCLALLFKDFDMAAWLGQINPEFGQRGPAKCDAAFQIVVDHGIRELRIDWTTPGAPTFTVPGAEITLPAAPQLTLVLGGTTEAGYRPMSRATLALTFAPHTALVAASNFAWERPDTPAGGTGDSEVTRENHAGEATSPGGGPATGPALQFTLTAQRAVSLALLDLDVTRTALPRFLQQVSPALSRPLEDPSFSGAATRIDLDAIDAADWTAELQLRLLQALPMLRGSGDEPQLLQLDPATTKSSIDLTNHKIVVDLGLIIAIGDLDLRTVVPIEFNWETLAFKVDHDVGLAVMSDLAELPAAGDAAQHLGLTWRFRGAPVGGRYQYFTLATKNNNYQLQQAPGAVFEVEYTELSDERIGFSIADFRLTSAGISLTGKVIDRPAKLNGIDTRFRFQDTQIAIVDNHITDFTLKGSGPLPPALVGDATADLALQLAQRDGKLTLVAGGAQLKGSKLLGCKGTRFELSLDGIGVKFVHEGKFHLYFTLTGSAQFKLAAGDDAQGALALLPNIRIDLVECPLAGDARAIAKHVNFLIELPRPLSFSFLGAFEMELRGIGFVPQADVFDGDGAMLITGQLKFAQGAGDSPDGRTDLHKLYIGLPKPGGIFPRIHFANLPVHLNFGSAFQLNGVVDFADSALEKGFSGEGVLTIQGLPTMAAAFSFLRVRRDDTSPWVRAWFIYLEARKISFQIPVVNVYLREVGLGFGYRFTVASIRAADEANDVKQLITELTKLSRTQGDLSKRDRWALDLEPQGQDPRWTVALRAMISQTSAQTSPLHYDDSKEQKLACLFLLDAVVALRSDLTFLMAIRGWLFTNYDDYVTDWHGIRGKPPVSGFVLLSPRHKRLLAHAASNPDGLLGPHPPLPPFVQRALSKSQFSTTLLVEPGLLHSEMGWPNQLRWADSYGPINAEFSGGFLFRVTGDELVTGTSFLARAQLKIGSEINLGIVGAKVSAEASVAFGARYIGLVSLRDPFGASALYGGIGIEALIQFAVEFWIRIKLSFIKVTKKFRFSASLQFTAGLEIGFVGISTSGIGVRGTGQVAVSAMGRRLALTVHLGMNEDAVATALERTKHVLELGLEASDVDGSSSSGDPRTARLAAKRLPGLRARAAVAPAVSSATARSGDGATSVLHVPGYSLFLMRGADRNEPSYFLLFPAGETDKGTEEPGFLPPPPLEPPTMPPDDFVLRLPPLGDGVTLEQWVPAGPQVGWVRRTEQDIRWRADWDAPMDDQPYDADGKPVPKFTLRRWLDNAFVINEATGRYSDPTIIGAPQDVPDERVHNPSDGAFEAAVRGAMEQFRGSPFFRRDPASEYEQLLTRAFSDKTTVYHASGMVPDAAEEVAQLQQQQQAHEARGLIVHDMISDLRDHVAAVRAGRAGSTSSSVAFATGLVFRVTGSLAWLEGPRAWIGLVQRSAHDAAAPDSAEAQVKIFNVAGTDFATNPPRFERIQQLTDARTIALAWDLVWPTAPAGIDPKQAQADPEHHLIHYVVRRRALDSNDHEVVFTVKGADVLHREPADPETGAPPLLARLKRRFQLVDHFSNETVEDLAAIPVSGKRYLYSITPADFAGNSGRPLSLVATRFPSEPPQVPVNGECTVHYRIDTAALTPASAVAPSVPRIVPPAALTVTWRDPPAAPGAPSVPIATYRLVFRRDPTLPIGSYGLDSTTQRPPAKVLPTTNARPLPTDIKLALPPQGSSDDRRAVVSVGELQQVGILPADGRYRAESWRVWFQTVSHNGVPSALAPVQLLLRVVAATAGTYDPLAAPPNAREERRPAEIEWLPQPMTPAMLPPEDQAASVGPLHAPMPAGKLAPSTAEIDPGSFVFDPTLSNIGRERHPSGQRCIRLRWNQGPSGQLDYPLELNAGYHLLQLDTDAHTTETFASADRLAAALRTVQDVQMIPADELRLVPGDTLVPAQWEAWYPSAIQRRGPSGARAVGSEARPAPWYSWRDSVLEWPEWPDLTSGQGRRDSAFHPALTRLLALLTDPPADELTAYRLEVQAGPAMQPGDLAAFFRSTAPAADPYGWGVLQRFGLSVAFRLREVDTGEALPGDRLLEAVARALAFAAHEPAIAAASRHMHVELLFQPGRTFALEPGRAGSVATIDLLALVQVSLRPAFHQSRGYARVALDGKPGTRVPVSVVLGDGETCSVLDQADPAAGQSDLTGSGAQTVATRYVVIPVGGHTALLWRGAQDPDIRIPLSKPPHDLDALRAAIAPHAYATDPMLHIQLVASAPALGASRRDAIAAALDPEDAYLADALVAIAITRFAPTDAAAASFVIAPGALAADLVSGAAQTSWSALRRYVEALSSTDELAEQLRVPATHDEVEQLAPDFAAWSQRFFDHAGPVAAASGERHAAAAGGPWIATAYPRAGSPAHAAPDASGRLSYDHIVEDPWAHAYRFYVRPYGRYDLLWRSLWQSTVLFPDTPLPAAPAPEPGAGGLDVVLDRTRPVAMPLVLSSMRLDAPSTPANPAPPGSTWEVILAEHPEQTLIDHNQTLARQLAFRQVSYALIRRFAYPAWVQQLSRLIASNIVLEAVQDRFPGLPGAYPADPDQLPLPPAALSDADARRLDLPLRIGPFQQGALALQWEGLPFFYEHRLWVIAQTTTTVSPINEIIQRDFEYVTPDPVATIEPLEAAWRRGELPAGRPPITVRARMIHLALRTLWDALPERARQQWPDDKPDGVHRTPGWFPDLGVVYQVVEEFSGNVEVQAEVVWNETADAFVGRQLGKRFAVDPGAVTPPASGTAGEFSLALVVQQVTRQELSRAYDGSALTAWPDTRAKLAFDGALLVFTGVMTHDDLTALQTALDPADAAAVQDLHDAWYAQEPVSTAAVIPAELASVVDLPEPSDTPLVWEGPMSTEDRAALLALSGDDEFITAVRQLAGAVGSGAGVVSVVAPLGPEQVPAALAGHITLGVDAATGHYTELAWGPAAGSSGNLSDDDVQRLIAWPQVRALREATAALVAAADDRTCSVTLPVVPPASPWPEDLPSALGGHLVIELNRLTWRAPAPGDGARAALAKLGGDPAFTQALAQLMAAIDAAHGVPLGPVIERPTTQTLPPVLRDQLQIDPMSLSWLGDPPSSEQRTALVALPGDRGFRTALASLVTALDTGGASAVAMAPFVPRPQPSELPAVLQGRLVFEADTLRWTSPAPSDAERAALAALPVDDATRDAVTALWRIIDVDRTAAMTPRRPRQSDLPAWLGDQLQLERDRVTWTGRLHDASWREALNKLAGLPCDPAFAAAIVQILASIDAQVLAVPFTAAVRPAATGLGPLEDKLIIGRALLRYHGLMSRAEIALISAGFERTTDRRAVRRLYDRALAAGMRGRSLKLRTRRGSAPPSALTIIPALAPTP